MIIKKIKEGIKHLGFIRKAFTKGGFRHASNYISGLITSEKKTVKKIAESCPDEKHSSSLNRILNEAKFEKGALGQRYLKKIRYLFRNHDIFLIIDDTIVEHEGEHIEETQKHFNHTNNKYVQGPQFFTAILYTPFLQLPLFPELYSKNTDSKIAMAKDLVTKLTEAEVKIHTVLFDSWYSDKTLIKTCLEASIRVICGIKTNRKVKFFRGRKYYSLSFVSKKSRVQNLYECEIDSKKYAVWSKEAYLNGLPLSRLVISRELLEDQLGNQTAHFISTNLDDTDEEILRTYKIRWKIETYHRDIKQNLGFAGAFFRNKEGIVRHAIFVAIAYALLSLFMFTKGVVMTIGTCCEYLRDKVQSDLVSEIVMIEDKDERLEKFEEVFISKSRKV